MNFHIMHFMEYFDYISQFIQNIVPPYILEFIPLQIIIPSIIQICILLAGVLLGVAYFTYAERKVLAAMQRRKGPNVVGPFGLLQPIADGMKMAFKEVIIPSSANKILFFLAPMITLSVGLISWAVIPFAKGVVIADINVGVLYLLATSSLGIYGIIIAGWASKSAYAFLGAIRSAAQMISYEVSIGFVLITVLISAGSLNLTEIVEAQTDGWFIFSLTPPLFPMFIVFIISALAETNRTPFDLPEAEGELVAGYFVEYSSLIFGMFFLGEYANIMLMSAVGTTLFLGGWLPLFEVTFIPPVFWFLGKTIFLMFIFLWTRASLPRMRFDQLMRLGWKIFLPLTLVWVVITAGFKVFY